MRGNSPGRTSNIFVHPAALLIAVIATAFFKSTEARALTDEHKPGENRTTTGLASRSDNISMLETHKTIIMDAVQSAVILSAVASVLQTPSLFATTQGVTDAVAATSDLLDFAAWSATAHHTGFQNRGQRAWRRTSLRCLRKCMRTRPAESSLSYLSTLQWPIPRTLRWLKRCHSSRRFGISPLIARTYR